MVHSPAFSGQLQVRQMTPPVRTCGTNGTDRLSKKVLNTEYWSWTRAKIYVIWTDSDPFYRERALWKICLLEGKCNPGRFLETDYATLVSAKWCLSVLTKYYIYV